MPCLNLNYTISKVVQPQETIVIQTGVYELDYSVEIVGKVGLTIVGWNYQNSENTNYVFFLVDFANPIWKNYKSVITIKDSQEIRFENIIFIDRNYYHKLRIHTQIFIYVCLQFFFFFFFAISIIQTNKPKKKNSETNITSNLQTEKFSLFRVSNSTN
ncbi:hypothetical protein RFI_05887, partial [Reticulomyxa filosa]